MSPTEKLVDRLRKLKAHAESAEAIGSEAEAQAFAAMFQRLLTENKLEMSDIDFEKYQREQPLGQHWIDYNNYPDVKLRKRRVSWIEDLARTVSWAHSCRYLVYDGSSRISFIGRPEDTKVVEYMFITLLRATEKLADEAYAKYSIECVNECEGCGRKKTEHRGNQYCADGGFFEPNWAKCRGFRPSFIAAFINRLLQRYAEEKRKMEQQYGTQALVRVQTPAKAFEDFFKQEKIKNAKELSNQVISNAEGYRRGRKAADAINLKANAVEGTGKSQRQIKG